MKRVTVTRSLREEETEDAIVEDVKSILKEAFTSKIVNDCPCPECANNIPAPSVSNDIIETLGGAQTTDDISLWQASLADPTAWAVSRTLRVESVISLFDEVTRAKILAVVPQAVLFSPTTPTTPSNATTATSFRILEPTTKVPLHRLFSPRSGIHFYTTKSAEVDSAVRVHGYNYETLAAHILPEIDESELTDTVPLYRVHRGTKHLYTIDLNEVQGGQGHGLVGYVHATKQPGTVPLYRIFNPRTDAHLFTTNVNEKESLLKVGWADEGVTCYVHL
ncbi:hypothetical protein BC629DRAFT_1496756 [Irpex lacteus]|nr:hypothetical protein BC629DRAFT_1496756 [Irpex lacteus]